MNRDAVLICLYNAIIALCETLKLTPSQTSTLKKDFFATLEIGVSGSETIQVLFLHNLYKELTRDNAKLRTAVKTFLLK